MDTKGAAHILGLNLPASLDEIRKRYRELVKQYHPDKHTSLSDQARSAEKFIEIKEAYDLLVRSNNVEPQKDSSEDEVVVNIMRARESEDYDPSRSFWIVESLFSDLHGLARQATRWFREPVQSLYSRYSDISKDSRIPINLKATLGCVFFPVIVIVIGLIAMYAFAALYYGLFAIVAYNALVILCLWSIGKTTRVNAGPHSHSRVGIAVYSAICLFAASPAIWLLLQLAMKAEWQLSTDLADQLVLILPLAAVAYIAVYEAVSGLRLIRAWRKLEALSKMG